jgi:hypothetical protein
LSIDAPVITSPTTAGAHISTATPTGLTGPLTYQYERWQGSGNFTPGPVTVTPHDSSDGTWTPSSLTFAVDGTNTPAAQTLIYTPASNGTKTFTFTDNRDLTDPAPITYVVAAYSVPGTAYTSPTVAQVLRWTGINAAILDSTDNELIQVLGELIVLAEAETALEVTETRFVATNLSKHQIMVLQLSVAYHATANFLICPAIRVLTGTQEPLLMQGGDTLDDISRLMHSRATELSTLYATGDVSQIGTRMAMNATRALR